MSKKLYGHCAKLLGWGEESNVKYWLYMNTWGRDWGDYGTLNLCKFFFKIKKKIRITLVTLSITTCDNIIIFSGISNSYKNILGLIFYNGQVWYMSVYFRIQLLLNLKTKYLYRQSQTWNKRYITSKPIFLLLGFFRVSQSELPEEVIAGLP